MNARASLHTGEADTLIVHRFTVPGMRCAGCIGKIERELKQVAGIAEARVNFSAKRVAVRHQASIDEAGIVRAFEKMGFEAQPVAANPLAQDDTESNRLLRAVAVAGFAMMNIMLLSVSVWSGAGGVTRELFHWLSAIIAIPVIAYAGRPFFASALMALRYRRANMDVPISIGILLATGLSIYETAIGGEHAYFDGAVMLLFFLLAGRALDATVRDKARSGIAGLLSHMGRGASIVAEDGTTRWVNSEDLQPGMIMIVAAGEALASDGIVVEGSINIDNSMLTLGQPRPVDLSVLDGESRAVALALAQASRHPLSKGLESALQLEGVTPAQVSEIEEVAGRGVPGNWRGSDVALHRPSGSGEAPASELVIGEQYFRLEFTDALRPDANATLAELQRLGLSSQIFSGDRREETDAIGRELRIEAGGAMMPQDKLAKLEVLKAAGHRPLMVGDGLNDRPALAAAHVSIAPGSASDVSQ